MDSITDLRFREAVHEKYGFPNYVMDGKCVGWGDSDGNMQHPELVDNYSIAHCSVDVSYIGGKIHHAAGCVSIDGWDVCSREYLYRE